MRSEAIYCGGHRTNAVYWPALRGWYCARCGARVSVVTTDLRSGSPSARLWESTDTPTPEEETRCPT